MKFMGELSNQEIAIKTGQSVKTASMQTYRGLEKLKLINERPENIAVFEIPILYSLLQVSTSSSCVEEYKILQHKLPTWATTFIKELFDDYPELDTLKEKIQRPYEDNVNAYYEDISKRFKDGEVFNQDSIKQNGKLIYKTLLKGRKVFGGGGITPDIFVPLDTSMINPFVSEVFGLNLLQEFSYNYYNEHKAAFNAFANLETFKNNFKIDNNFYGSFTAYCFSHGANKESAVYTEQSRVYLSNKLKAFIAKQKWKSDGFYSVSAQDDKMVQRALQELK